MVGRACLEMLLAEPEIAQVLSLGRRRLPLVETKLEQMEVDFAALPPSPMPLQAACCALGTTRKLAGSDEAFRRVDLDFVANFARWARVAGATRFVLVSSVGADASSGALYLRTKGEAEATVQAAGFESVTLLRPSLLLGDRAEQRTGERIGIAVANVLAPLCVGPLSKYRPISGQQVAAAALAAIKSPRPGVSVLHFAEM